MKTYMLRTPAGSTDDTFEVSRGIIYQIIGGQITVPLLDLGEALDAGFQLPPTTLAVTNTSPKVQSSALYYSNAIKDLQVSPNPQERYQIGFQGQEASMWCSPIDGRYWLNFTGPPGNQVITYCPANVDPTDASIFFASISGSTLTVSEPNNSISPDLAGPIKPGMTLQSGSGATVLPFGTAGTTGLGGNGTYALSTAPGDVLNAAIMSANFFAVPIGYMGYNVGGMTLTCAHGYIFRENGNLYNFFVDTVGIQANVSVSGNVMTVNTVTSGPPTNMGLVPNLTIVGTSFTSGTYIQSQQSGTTGGAGVYILSASLGTIASENVVIGNQCVRIAVSSEARIIANPADWTLQTTVAMMAQPALGIATGNCCVVNWQGTYYLFQEMLVASVNPVERNASTWKICMLTSPIVVGNYTMQLAPVQSLAPSANASWSGAQILIENNELVMIYHAGTWGRMANSDIYRATTTNPASDSWVITNKKSAIARRKAIGEVDQLGDPFLCQTAGGAWLMVYEGADNRTSQFPLTLTWMLPTLKQWDGIGYRRAQAGYDANDWVNNPNLRWRCGINAAVDQPTAKYGAWVPTVNANSITNAMLVSDGAQGNYIDFDIERLAPGTYDFGFNYQANANGGIATIIMEDGSGFFNYTLAPNMTNLLLFSNLFTSSAYTKLNLSAAAASSIGPFGATDATTLTATATGACRINQFYSNITAAQPYTIQLEMQAGTANGYLAFVAGSVQSYATFNLTGHGSVAAISGTGATATITPAPAPGWYLCTLTQPAATTASLFWAAGPQDNTGTSSGYPACTTGKTVNISRAQMEPNAIAGLYAPTTTLAFDTYSASTLENQLWQVRGTVLGRETMRRKIRAIMNTRNASNTVSYGMSLISMNIQRVTL